MFKVKDKALVISNEEGHLGKVVIIHTIDPLDNIIPYCAIVREEGHFWFREDELITVTKIGKILYAKSWR